MLIGTNSHSLREEDYPPGDPSVGGGLMARVAPMYPNKAIDLGSRIQPLPEDGGVPGLPEFKWSTPGHSPGHISVPRTGSSSRSGRRGDYGEARVGASRHRAGEGAHGPPMYFTPDWDLARESVRRLASLNPGVLITGHGVSMRGEELTASLERLARDFDRLAVPEQGRYVDREPN